MLINKPGFLQEASELCCLLDNDLDKSVALSALYPSLGEFVSLKKSDKIRHFYSFEHHWIVINLRKVK